MTVGNEEMIIHNWMNFRLILSVFYIFLLVKTFYLSFLYYLKVNFDKAKSTSKVKLKKNMILKKIIFTYGH